MATLEDWLNRNVETEQYRSRVRCVALGLGDLCACELVDLEEDLDLASWPSLAKKRFLKAWRALKKEGAAAPLEEAPRPPSPPPPGPPAQVAPAQSPDPPRKSLNILGLCRARAGVRTQ